jgi:hypothetical protein
MSTRNRLLLVLAASLASVSDVTAKQGSSLSAEGMRLFYMPLSIGTLKAVDQSRIEVEGDLCVIRKGSVVASIRKLLALAKPAKSDREKFANESVRIKIWPLGGKKEKPLAVLEADGRMLRERKSFFLPEKPLYDLENVIAAECFGGVTDPFKSDEFKRGEQLRRERLRDGQRSQE